MHLSFIIWKVLTLYTLLLVSNVDGWRRRRTSSCSQVNCLVSSWTTWSPCTASCGDGNQRRTRTITRAASCGGACPYSLSATRTCNTRCCPIGCLQSWTTWGACEGSGAHANRTRHSIVTRQSSCNGTECPATPQFQKCNNASCSPVNCTVGSWGNWSSCNASCEQVGFQNRTRPVLKEAACNGVPCPTTLERQSCKGPCCPKNCVVSGWSEWGACEAPQGVCSVGAGLQVRTRSIMKNESCGGSCTFSLSEKRNCTSTSFPCKLPRLLVKENSDENVVVGNLSSSAEDVNVTYRLSNDAGGRFKVEGDQIKVALPNERCLKYGGADCRLNYEKQKEHVISVITTDSGAPAKSFEVNITVYVTDVNERPRNIKLSNFSLREDAPTGQVIGQFSADDEDKGQVLTFTLVTNDNNIFGINNKGELYKATNKTDFETSSSHQISVGVEDNGVPSLKAQSNFKIEILDVNEAPMQTSITAVAGGLKFTKNKPIVEENRAPGAIIGKIISYDSDPSEQMKFILDNDGHGAFGLGNTSCTNQTRQTSIRSKCSVSLLTRQKLNFEQRSTYPIVVHTFDNAGLFHVAKFTIQVKDLNEPQTDILLNGNSSSTVNENAKSAFLGLLKTTDEDLKQDYSYAIDNASKRFFEIIGNKLKIKEGMSLDYEKQSVYKINITSVDNQPEKFTISKTIVIYVRNINERPTDIVIANMSVTENSKIGTIISIIRVIDPDNSGKPHSTQLHNCSLLKNGNGMFQVRNNTILVSGSGINFEQDKVYTLKIKCMDDGYPVQNITKEVRVKVTDVNDRPSNIALSATMVREDAPPGSVVGSFMTVDEDAAQRHVYSIIQTPPNFPFIINGSILQTKNNLDFETQSTWKFRVRSVDDGIPEMSIVKWITVNISDVNEPPSDVILSNASIPENSGTGQVVGVLTTKDSDLGQSYSYTLESNPNSIFRINGEKLEVVASNKLCLQFGGRHCMLNHEKQSSITVKIKATDNGFPPQSISKAIRVDVLDVNEEPYNITLSQNKVFENATIGKAIGTFSANDEDAGQMMTFTLIKDDDGRFNVTPNGSLRLRKGFNVGKTVIHSIVVQVMDDGIPKKKAQSNFKIEVLNVNEAPMQTSIIAVAGGLKFTKNKPIVEENRAPGTIIGKIISYDSDLSEQMKFILDNDGHGAFGLGNTSCTNLTGQTSIRSKCSVSLLTRQKLNFEQRSTYPIVVRTFDNAGLFHVAKFTIQVKDLNEPQTDILLNGNSSSTVNENAKSAFLGLLKTTDEDLKQDYSYAIDNASKRFFEMIGNKLKIKEGMSLDYEQQSVYKINITSVDNQPEKFTISKTIVIYVENINERPTDIVIANMSVTENSKTGTIISNIRVIDPDNSGKLHPTQSHKCSLLQNGNGMFQVRNNTILVSGSGINFEQDKVYTLKVKCVDDGYPVQNITKEVRVKVTDANDRPSNIALSATMVREDAPPGSVVGSFMTVDEDAVQRHVYTIIKPPQNFPFIINGSNLQTKNNLDFETQNTWKFRVRSVDNGIPEMSIVKWITVNISDVNEPPSDVILSNASIPENSGTGQVVGVLTTIDPDLGQSYSYTLESNPNSIFRINGDKLEVGVSNKLCLQFGGKHCMLNHEKQSSITIKIKATDNGFPPQSFSKAIGVDVLDVNEKPFNLTLSQNEVFENATIGQAIGTFFANDEDAGQTMTFTLIKDDDGHFNLTPNGLLCVSKGFNFEKTAIHSIVVQVMDNGIPKMKAQSNFKIEILNVNEAPIQTSIIAVAGGLKFTKNKPIVEENRAPGTIIGKIISYDSDLSEQMKSILDNDGHGAFGLGNTSCTNQTGQTSIRSKCSVSLLTIQKLNFEQRSTYPIVVRTFDNAGLFHVAKFTIQVKDLNEPQTDILLNGNSSSTVNENAKSAFLGILKTTDEDLKQDYSYAIDNASKRFFEMIGNKLKIKEGMSLDYEKQPVHKISITSLDNQPEKFTISKTIVIYVKNINERPTDIVIANMSVTENSKIGTIISNIRVIDPDNSGKLHPTQSHKCSLLQNGNGMFQVRNNTILVSGSGINFEQDKVYTLKIKCMDDGYPVQNITKEVRVKVTDANDRPSNIALSATVVREDAPPGSVVGSFMTVDEDVAQRHVYLIIQPPPNLPFIINGSNLQTKNNLDFETQSTWKFRVRSVDNGIPEMSIVKWITVNISDVNEPPSDVILSNASIPENSGTGQVVGVLSTKDSDLGQSYSYTLESNPNSIFRINGDKLEVVASNKLCLQFGGRHCMLNHEKQSSITIKIKATDNGFPPQSISKAIGVDVLDVNEEPFNLTLSQNEVFENATVGQAIGTFSANDEDAGQTMTFTLIKDDDGHFNLTPNGLLSVNKGFNFEKTVIHSIVVQVMDDGIPQMKTKKVFQIIIKDVNEMPGDLKITSQGGKTKFLDDRPVVYENMPRGTVLGTIVGVDFDASQKLSFKILGNSNFNFELDNASYHCKNESSNNKMSICHILLKTQKVFNFEEKSKEELVIQTEDNHGITLTKVFTVAVMDKNDPPRNLTISGGLVVEVNENAVMKYVGTFGVIDEDVDQNFSYRLIDSADTQFVMKGNKLYTSSNATLNFEKKSTIKLAVEVTDNGSPPLSLLECITVLVKDVNEAPTEVKLYPDYIKENSPSGSYVGNLTVSDPDNEGNFTGRQTYKCVLANASNEFTVRNNQLWTTSENLDYEAKSKYLITVKCTDNGTRPLSISKAFTVIIRDENEPPVSIRLNSTAVYENRVGAVVADLTVVDPDNDSRNHVLKLISGADYCLIVGTVLKTRRAMNFEKQKFFKVSIKAVDNGGLCVTNNFTIQVLDANDPPSKMTVKGPLSLPEDSQPGTYIGTVSTVDEDSSQVHLYVITYVTAIGYGKTKSETSLLSLFKLGTSNGVITLAKGILNYEEFSQYNVTITTVDNGVPGMSYNQTVVINVTNVNQAPTDISLTNAKVLENSANGSVVGTLLVTDPDNQNGIIQTHTCAVTAASPFTVVNKTILVVHGLVDYEESKVQPVQITCSEDINIALAIKKTLMVKVINVNEPPNILALNPSIVIENNSPNTIITEVQVEDPDNKMTVVDNITLILGDTQDTTLFYLDGTRLIAKTSFNYEKRKAYVLPFIAKDDGNPPLQTRKSLTLEVKDVNEAPTEVKLYPDYIKENSPSGSYVGNLTVSDPDNEGNFTARQTHRCVLDNASKEFTIRNNELWTTSENLDYEAKSKYLITVKCTDNGTRPLSISKAFTVIIRDENEAPANIRLNSTAVYENRVGAVVADLTVVDPDNDSRKHVLKLMSGADDCLIVGTVLKTRRAMNFEKQKFFKVSIKAVDNGGLSVTNNFTIQVLDANDPPSKMTVKGPLSLPEDSQPGTYIGTVSAVDEDSSQIHHYVITYVTAIGYGKTKSETSLLLLFKLGTSNGVITLAKGILNYEEFSQYNVNITTVDNGVPRMSYNQTVVIHVTNVNQAPTDISLTNAKVLENSANGSVVGTLLVTDPDNQNGIIQTHTCAVTAGSPFMVVNKTILVVHGLVDYEESKVQPVQITCSEDINNALAVKKTLMVKVINVNEPPNILALNPSIVIENNSPNAIITEVQVEDPDNKMTVVDNITLILGDTQDTALFYLNGRSLIAKARFNYEKRKAYVLPFIAKDDGNPPLQTRKSLTLEIKDANDPPSGFKLSSDVVYENATINTVIGLLTAQDEDANQKHSFTLINTLAEIKIRQNEVVVANKLDYETKNRILISVNVTDNGNPAYSFQGTKVINVKDANDAPEIVLVRTYPLPEVRAQDMKAAEITIADQDKSQTHQCYFDGWAASSFFFISKLKISTLMLNHSTKLDFETAPTISVHVNCIDSGNPPLSMGTDIKLTVTDVNEPPHDVTINGRTNISVKETVPLGAVLGTLGVTDEDTGQSHKFILLGTAQSWFTINDTTNSLAVRNAGIFDYESLPPNKTLSVGIVARDNGVPPMEGFNTLYIHVTDVNEAPENLRLVRNFVQGIPENISIGTQIGELTVNNAESKTQTIAFELLNWQDVFKVQNKNATNDVPTLVLKSSLDFDKVKFYDLELKAVDSGSPSKFAVAVINLKVIPMDPCSLGVLGCAKNATCIRFSKASSRCVCNSGFSGSGKNCTSINDCKPTCKNCFSKNACSVNETCPACFNGGICIDRHETFQCNCLPGFTDSRCSKNINECVSSPCLNNGTCIDGINSYQCKCKVGFNGTHCEENINDCSPNPCVSGHCVDLIDGFSCNCSAGIRGLLCERRSKNCAKIRCAEDQICVPPRNTSESVLSRAEQSRQCVYQRSIVRLSISATCIPEEQNLLRRWLYKIKRYIFDKIIFPENNGGNNKQSLSRGPIESYIAEITRNSSRFVNISYVLFDNKGSLTEESAVQSLNRTCNEVKEKNKDIVKCFCQSVFVRTQSLGLGARTASSSDKLVGIFLSQQLGFTFLLVLLLLLW